MVDTKSAELAADFTATDAEGRIVRLSDYRGKKYIVLNLIEASSDPTTGGIWRSCVKTIKNI